MYITLIISSLNSGGAERTLSELANVLALKGHQVSLITFSSSVAIPFYFLDTKINLIHLDQCYSERYSFLRRFKNIVKRILCLRKTIQKIKPNIVISFIDVTNITTLIATRGLTIPILVSERTHPSHHQLPKFYQVLRRIFYSKAAAIVVQTTSAAEYFNRNGFENIKVIPNAVSKSAQKKVKVISSSLVKNIVSVGRLSPFKGFDILIKAFHTFLFTYPYLTLTIYGEGNERLNLEKLIHFLGLQNKVFLPGVIQNIQEAFLNADLFIFPSRYEGFPNALCEAMAVGLPVIASDCSGNVDIVRDGIDGRFFPVGDVQALTKITLELLDDAEQRQQLAEKAKEICDRFESNHIFKLWDEVIVEAVRSYNEKP